MEIAQQFMELQYFQTKLTIDISYSFRIYNLDANIVKMYYLSENYYDPILSLHLVKNEEYFITGTASGSIHFWNFVDTTFFREITTVQDTHSYKEKLYSIIQHKDDNFLLFSQVYSFKNAILL